MSKIYNIYIVSIVAFLIVTTLDTVPSFSKSRRGGALRLHYADSLVGSLGSEGKERTLYGNIWLSQDSMNIYADFAKQHLVSNVAIIRGNVKMIRPNARIYADSAKYEGYMRLLTTQSYIGMIDTSENVLTANRGRYDINAEVATFFGDVTVENDSIVILADNMRYERITGNAFGKNNVALKYRAYSTTIFGDTVKYFPNEKYAYASGFPSLIKIDTNKSDTLYTYDTMLVVSSKMEVIENNQFVFSGIADIFLNELIARSDIAIYYREEELITLSGKPTLWMEENQISADTIAIFLKDEEIQRIYCEGKAICMMKTDSAFTSRIDQVSGDSVIISFADNKINKIVAEGQAKSLYFMSDEGGLFGVDRTSTDAIKIFFEDNEPIKIDWLGESSKDFIEPIKVIKNESEYYLPYFNWKQEKPEKHHLPEICD